ncbi:cytochrome b [Ramlibacter algicola]|uniref:Cytochrome b n=1 Tax=Ramlibacter algicola TaxID=2795217 RepID=A0A934PZQ8_9BURK|nr:cytochrome b [Ramlibacter algicola]MBK0392012.1 cytochrome b [Ramlibacter algicola]
MHATPDRYTRTAIALHWLVALGVLAQVALGWWMLDIPKEPPGLRAGWFNLHKSIGLTLGLLVLARLAWRARHPAPALAGVAPWQRHASRTVHALLYMCLLVQPLSGLFGSLFTRYPIKYFGMTLPAWNHEWAAGKEAMAALHLASAWLLMALVALHVAAAVWHLVRRDGIAQRMLWHRKEHAA